MQEYIDDFLNDQASSLSACSGSSLTRYLRHGIFKSIAHFCRYMQFNRLQFALMAIIVNSLLMPLSQIQAAELSFWFPCTGSKAKSEQRTVDIRSYLNVNTVGMKVNDIEDLYCVTRVKCVALGYCAAASPEEQAAADKLQQEIAAEERRLQQERQAKAAQAERERQRVEQERIRQAAAAAEEKQRRATLAAAEAQRLKLSMQDASKLVEARENARKKMPVQPEKCAVDYPASTTKLDFTPIIMLESKAKKDYAAVDRSKMCNGHPGTLEPLQCSKSVNFFGANFASCEAMMRCPARQEIQPCNRVSAQ